MMKAFYGILFLLNAIIAPFALMFYLSTNYPPLLFAAIISALIAWISHVMFNDEDEDEDN